MKTVFRTEIKLKKGEFPEISYSSKLFFLGSCFSDRIGGMFEKNKFQVLTNPFGVSYNPVSINTTIQRIIGKNYFTEEDLISKDDLFNSYELHGSFDNESSSQLISAVNTEIDSSHDFLKTASHIYITPGTSWVYRLKENGKIVNNCHKQRAELFTRELLTLEEVSSNLISLISEIKKINPSADILFTISPVRHLKDGFSENNLSKSILRLAIDSVLQENSVYYFPSFEMVIDDLRDYRFYTADMLHPNEEAEKYIWDLIMENQMSEKTNKLVNEVSSFLQDTNHRSFNKNSASNKQFLRNTLEKAKKIQESLPGLNLKFEIQSLESRLSK